MNINERVRYFRKEIMHMNQTEFAIRLGMKQTSVSTFEKSGATVTDQTINTLCLSFNLNENWIRYGKEPMYKQSTTFSLDNFILQKGASEIEIEIIKTYFELDPKIRKAAIEHFKKHLSSSVSSNYSQFNDVPNTPEELEKEFPPVESDKKNEVG